MWRSLILNLKVPYFSTLSKAFSPPIQTLGTLLTVTQPLMLQSTRPPVMDLTSSSLLQTWYPTKAKCCSLPLMWHRPHLSINLASVPHSALPLILVSTHGLSSSASLSLIWSHILLSRLLPVSTLQIPSPANRLL